MLSLRSERQWRLRSAQSSPGPKPYAPGDRVSKQRCKAAALSKPAPQRRIDEVAVEATHCVERGVAALDAEAVVLVRDVRERR